MIAILLFISATSGAGGNTPIGRDIRAFCRDRPACVAVQLEASRNFIGSTVMFDAPQAVSERCLRQAKVGGLVDWTIARACIRGWSKGRDNVFARGMKQR